MPTRSRRRVDQPSRVVRRDSDIDRAPQVQAVSCKAVAIGPAPLRRWHCACDDVPAGARDGADSFQGNERDTFMKTLRTTGVQILVSLGLLAMSGCKKEIAKAAPPPPIVTVSAPVVREVLDADDYTGRIMA